MSSTDDDHAAQLGFDALLAQAETENRARIFERETGHLPDSMEEALPFYRDLIDRHHAAMLAAAVDDTMHLREEARRLALRLNVGEPGIIAGPDAPGCVLARETAVTPESVPLWGQTGAFTITLDTMRVRIEQDGIFGIGGGFTYWPGFSAHAADLDRPFLSETGYRSFLGIHAEPVPDMTPDAFAREAIAVYIERELKGRTVRIEPQYRNKDCS